MNKSLGKRVSDIFIVGFIIFCGGLIVTNIAMAMLGGKSPQIPLAQKTFNSTGYAHCVATQNLANAKLNDYLDGFIDLTDEDVLRLKEKKEMNCKEIWGL